MVQIKIIFIILKKKIIIIIIIIIFFFFFFFLRRKKILQLILKELIRFQIKKIMKQNFKNNCKKILMRINFTVWITFEKLYHYVKKKKKTFFFFIIDDLFIFFDIRIKEKEITNNEIETKANEMELNHSKIKLQELKN